MPTFFWMYIPIVIAITVMITSAYSLGKSVQMDGPTNSFKFGANLVIITVSTIVLAAYTGSVIDALIAYMKSGCCH